MGKYLNRHTLTAALFIVVIFCLSVLTVRSALGSVSESDTAPSDFAGAVDSAEAMFDDGLYLHGSFIDIWALTQRALGTQLFDDAEYGYIIRDNHGLLHFPCERYSTAGCAERVSEFAGRLADAGIPLVYVQAPNKKLEGYTIFPPGGLNYSNENADEFLAELAGAGVDTLDLRKVLPDRIDPADMFYKTDHHWTTPAAFEAFRALTEYLNVEYSLGIDPDGFYRDSANYSETVYEDCFLGSLGRRVGRLVAGLDDYTLIKPDFETDYTVFDLAESDEAPIHTGGFDEAILHMGQLENPDVTTNRYTAYFEWDYGHLVIKNDLAKNDIRLLLIKDSFSLPVAAFLSTCVSEVHMLDLRGMDVTPPSEYVKGKGFDAVIIMYNPESIYGDMFKLTANK